MKAARIASFSDKLRSGIVGVCPQASSLSYHMSKFGGNVRQLLDKNKLVAIGDKIVEMNYPPRTKRNRR